MIDDNNFIKDRFYEIEQRTIRHTDTLFDSVAARVQKLEKQVHDLEQINKNVSDRSRVLKSLMENPPSIDPDNLTECPYCSHAGEDLEEHMVECEKRESEAHEKFVREEGIVCGTTRLMRERAQASALISEIERHLNRLNAPLDRQIRELQKLIGFEDQKLRSMAEGEFPEESAASSVISKTETVEIGWFDKSKVRELVLELQAFFNGRGRGSSIAYFDEIFRQLGELLKEETVPKENSEKPNNQDNYPDHWPRKSDGSGVQVGDEIEIVTPGRAGS